MFDYSRSFGRKALPDAKVLWPTRLTRFRPPNLAEGRRCGRLRRVRLRGASHLMEMDGGCGAQRPLWRASTSGGTAPGGGVRHSGHGCRPDGTPPPPRSDRSGPPPPSSTATTTTHRPPPPTRRGGGPELAGNDGRAVAAAHRGPHCPPPPDRRPTAPMTPFIAPAGTRRPLPQHNARSSQSGAGRQRPGSGGLAVAAASRSPNRPAARGERACPTPRLQTNRRRTRHYTHHSLSPPHQPPHRPHAHHRGRNSPAPHHASCRTQHSPSPRHASRRTDGTPATTPYTRPHPTTPAPAPTARVPPHPTIPRTPPRQPPHPTFPRIPPRQTPHGPHARHRALRTRAAPHPGTHHL